MAIKEITKAKSDYPDGDLESQFISVPGDEGRQRRAIVAKVALVWEQRRFIFRCAAIAFVASTLIVLLIPVRYTSTTRLMPPDQANQGITAMLAAVSSRSGESSGLGSLLGLKTTGDLFVGVLQSRSVADDLINKFDLRKVYSVRWYEDARKILRSRTDVSSDRKSGIITVTISDRSPERAAAMEREYIEALNSIVITLNTSSAHKERVFLEQRLSQVKQDLEQAEQDFSQFASKNTALDVKEQGRAMIGAAAELEGELIAAQTELEGLRQIYTANNVRVRSVQAKVEEYRRQLQRLGGSPPGADATGSDDAEPARQSQDPYPSIRQLPILGVTWSDLYRRTKVQETVFEVLTKQYELAKVEEARETPSVKVLDPADVPETKSFPPRTILVAACTVFVFCVSTVWVLAHARWQDMDPNDPGKALADQISLSLRTSVKRIASRVRYRAPREQQSSDERD
jgi:capsule polysaccharide export protein KpsE/RkpR